MRRYLAMVTHGAEPATRAFAPAGRPDYPDSAPMRRSGTVLAPLRAER
jgi:hypothetical protein